MRYAEKVSEISSKDCERVSAIIADIAERIRRKYPHLKLTYEDLNRWLKERVNHSV